VLTFRIGGYLRNVNAEDWEERILSDGGTGERTRSVAIPKLAQGDKGTNQKAVGYFLFLTNEIDSHRLCRLLDM
jgi:hypothetical protein